MMDKKMHVKNTNTWVRLAYMLLFGFLLNAGGLAISAIVLAQFLFVLITGKDNDNLRNLGQGLAKWVCQTIMFLTFNNETKPFPFAEWPVAESSQGYSSAPVDMEEVVDTQEESEELSDSSIPSFIVSDESDKKPQNKDGGKPKKGD
ncbi:MAG: DUF4389 domain-containing protein [Proteobacteria bacterium]|jgi:hypothetical protein|nr:DUF4389 domain-containing protein [Pseudomonadota bacterium]MDA1351896.1 DUF4389 domain-containing protein [Pseudomonadota bacterium]